MGDMSKITKEWITTAEAAAVLGCTTRGVRKMVQQGRVREVVIHPRMSLVNTQDIKREARTPQPTGRPRGS